MKGINLKGSSIRKKILLPMIAALVLQALLFSGSILWGGTIDRLRGNAFDILNERVINRKNDLQNEMLQRWSNIEGETETVRAVTTEILMRYGKAPADIKANSDLAVEILDAASEGLISLLRKNSVTGVFLILDGEDPFAREGHPVQKSGLYLRDLDPASVPRDNSDLLMEVAPARVAQKLGVSLDTAWRPQFAIEENTPYNTWDFYYKPLEAARQSPGSDYQNLGYWSHPYRLTETGIDSIAYSLPLCGADGLPYGVIGVEISLDHLRRMMRYDELGRDKKGAYLLAVDSGGDKQFQNIVSSGPEYLRLYNGNGKTTLDQNEVGHNTFLLTGNTRTTEKGYGCVQYFNLYNANTPFEQEQWALIGIMGERSLLGFANWVRMIVQISLALSIAAGFVIVWLTGAMITRPIAALAAAVRASDPRRPIRLEPIEITEIDELLGAIETLSRNVADNASKLSRILGLAGMPIGAFEYQRETDTVTCTEQFLKLFQLEEVAEGDSIAADLFDRKMRGLQIVHQESAPEHTTRIFLLKRPAGEEYWVRMKLVTERESVLGVASDITEEVLERRKLERERDHDLLTDLLNRRAFNAQMEKRFEKPAELGIAVMVMIDLDNLKYINDTYGHDCGDEYIRCTANALRRYSPENALISRMSGDEFHAFLYGFPSKEAVRIRLEALYHGIRDTAFLLPEGGSLRVRASAGIAWYPDDSDSITQLQQYADFAMYQVKNTTKGEFKEFDRQIYDRDSYLLQGREELNRMIDCRLIDYAFQPIVDVSTGTVFAYEALMRPNTPTLRRPAEVLALAKDQSKLYEIERLTWFGALESFQKFPQWDSGCKLFINSISDQWLREMDIDRIEQLYGSILPRVVIELTEEEQRGEECTSQKRAVAEKWGAEVALDDFGNGYNGEAALLDITPDYVKIDLSLVRDIDIDQDRQMLLRNILSYTSGRGIRVIAEGVETRAEMETLVLIGVDYIQGFLTGRPEYIPGGVIPAVKELLCGAYARKNTSPPEE